MILDRDELVPDGAVFDPAADVLDQVRDQLQLETVLYDNALRVVRHPVPDALLAFLGL